MPLEVYCFNLIRFYSAVCMYRHSILDIYYLIKLRITQKADNSELRNVFNITNVFKCAFVSPYLNTISLLNSYISD